MLRNSYIYDVEITLDNVNWFVHIPNQNEINANTMATILAGNSNVKGVRITKWAPTFIIEKIIKSVNYRLAN